MTPSYSIHSEKKIDFFVKNRKTERNWLLPDESFSELHSEKTTKGTKLFFFLVIKINQKKKELMVGCNIQEQAENSWSENWLLSKDPHG